jgi:small multidrug resistance family-3 protein
MLKEPIDKISSTLGPVGRVFYTLILYIFGICEIGGGWFIWQAMRANAPFYYFIIGGILLILYGFIACFQILEFATAYASYGGLFIVLSLLWGWIFDKQVPQIQDYIGGAICIVGACIIAFVPRK